MNWRLDDKDWYSNLNLGKHLRGPNRDQRPTVYDDHWGKTRHDTGDYRIFVNPLLTSLFPVLSKTGIYWHESIMSLPKEAQHEEASWKRMFFTQPPVNWMSVEYDSKDEEGEPDEEESRYVDWTSMSVRKLDGTQGLTMLDLFIELATNRSAAWIEGRQMWEEYAGAEDLGRVVVKSGGG